MERNRMQITYGGVLPWLYLFFIHLVAFMQLHSEEVYYTFIRQMYTYLCFFFFTNEQKYIILMLHAIIIVSVVQTVSDRPQEIKWASHISLYVIFKRFRDHTEKTCLLKVRAQSFSNSPSHVISHYIFLGVHFIMMKPRPDGTTIHIQV